MTINNLKELVKIYKNYVNDTHKINIDDNTTAAVVADPTPCAPLAEL